MSIKLLVSMLLAATAAQAQPSTEFWKSRDAYLAQPQPADTPVVFAPGALAESGTFVMGRVTFSVDGREFYYTQGNSWNSLEHARIRRVRFKDGKWTKPETVNEQFVSPTMSVDGGTLYFRRGNMQNIWRSRRVGDGWSAPEAFLEKDFGLYDFMPTASGNLYVGSEPDAEDAKQGSTYVFSRLILANGEARTRSLGRPLNTTGFNGDFFVAADESYMIVSTNETKDYESELYISFRAADGTWSKPESLGPKINNGLAHRWGQYVTPDGRFLFYSHGTSEKDCAVYWVRFDRLRASLESRH